MSLPADRPLPRWGDRTSLLAKQMTYAFSLSVSFRLELGAQDQSGARLSAVPASGGEPSTFHVLGKSVIVDGSGAVNEVPSARIIRGDDALSISSGSTGALDGRLFLLTDKGATLCIGYTGVINLRGGRETFYQTAHAPLDGTAFISTRHECDRPNLRWLRRCQLFGFGLVRARPESEDGHAPSRLLDFTFDLYAAA
jgi:hypothetical protein